ncbi:MAG: iron ABC transporter permease [Planctomycetota bacterium]
MIRRWNAWSLLCAGVTLCLALPLVALACLLFEDSEGIWRHLVATRLTGYLFNTIALAIGVGLLTLLIGTACAWLTSHFRFPGSRFISWGLVLPMAIPTYLCAYAYGDLLQASGFVQSSLRLTTGWSLGEYWFPNIFSVPGAIFLFSVVLYPYVYLAARSAFAEQSISVLEVSRTLGAGPWSRFFRVSLPLARPSLAVGCALVVMETMAEFGALDYLAVDTLATGVYRTWLGLGSLTGAAQLSAVLLSLVVAVIIVEQVLRGRRRHHDSASRPSARRRVRLSGWRAAGASAFCFAPLLFGFFVPLVAFMAWTVRAGDTRAAELFMTLGWNTIALAGIGSVVAVVLALILTYSAGRSSPRGQAISTLIARGGYAIPGGVIAIGVLIAMTWIDQRLADVTQRMGWQIELFITGTILAILAAYQVRFVGIAVGYVESGLTRVKPSLIEAARLLGASRASIIRRIVLPLVRPSLLASGLLVFVEISKELPATMILRPFDFDTIAVRVHQLAADERLEEASTGALALIGIGLLPVMLLVPMIASADRSSRGEANS